MTVAVRAARPGERPLVEALLGDADLRVVGVAPLVEAGRVIVAHDAGAGIVGCVALEPAGPQVLLRSLAVAPRHRGRGLGRRLVAAAVAAVPPGAELWLLTETAEEYFVGLGFVPVDRARATGPVTGTELWARSCPASAAALRLARWTGGRP